MESLFDVYFRKWCFRVNQIAFRDCQKSCKIMYFQELFIWLAPEHQLSDLIDALGRLCWLLAALWAPMVDLGGSWRKYMKTIVY